jgi:hypothetical protein
LENLVAQACDDRGGESVQCHVKPGSKRVVRAVLPGLLPLPMHEIRHRLPVIKNLITIRNRCQQGRENPHRNEPKEKPKLPHFTFPLFLVKMLKK